MCSKFGLDAASVADDGETKDGELKMKTERGQRETLILYLRLAG